MQDLEHLALCTVQSSEAMQGWKEPDLDNCAAAEDLLSLQMTENCLRLLEQAEAASQGAG